METRRTNTKTQVIEKPVDSGENVAEEEESEEMMVDLKPVALDSQPEYDPDSGTINLVPLPQARSEVWSYFGFLANSQGEIADKSRVICRLCGLMFCYSGNTTNFFSHIRSIHSEIHLKKSGKSTNATPIRTIKRSIDNDTTPNTSSGAFQAFQENPQETSHSVVESITAQNIRSPEEVYITADKITETLVEFIVTDCRPMDVLLGKGFQKILHLLAPGYKLPDRPRLVMALRQRYDALQKEKFTTDVHNLIS